MNICPKCKFDSNADDAEFCQQCGAHLTQRVDQAADMPLANQDDQMDFVVTETTGGGAPDFLTSGDDKPNRPELKTENVDDDKLEITANANLLADDNSDGPDIRPSDNEAGPIGESSPHLMPDDNPGQTTPSKPPESDMPAKKEAGQSGQYLPHLSQEEVANIKKELYGVNDSAKQKSPSSEPKQPKNNGQPDKQLDDITLETVDHPPNTVRPIQDPAQLPPIEKAGKVRGVAYFKKSFIQIAGNPSLRNGDEITVNDKPYVLRPKKINKKVTIGAFAAALVILLTIIGAQFIGPTISGDGEIIGMILGPDGEPYLEGATVSIPSLNKSVVSNPQGFFRFGMIPTGTYQVAFDLNGVYAGVGNITVTGGQSTLTSFGGIEPVTAQIESSPPVNENRLKETSKPAVQSPKSTSKKSSGTTAKKKSSKKSSQKTTPRYGKIKLNVNLSDARLAVDDEIIGAGSNTYSKIKIGERTIKVYKPGYAEHVKKITVRKNKTIEIDVTLTRDENLTLESLTADEWAALGNDMLAANHHQQAIKDYSNAIALSPGMIEAYKKRADLYLSTGEKSSAVGDYIRIGEIYRMKGKPAQAVSMFTNALDINPQNKVAMVGRGGAWKDQGNYRAGLVDFESALDRDKKFYPALYGSGVCEFKLGYHKKADKYFKKAYKINKNDPYLYQYMMLNYLAKDDIKKVRKTYSEFKDMANSAELAEFKSSSKFEPILRLIKEEDR